MPGQNVRVLAQAVSACVTQSLGRPQKWPRPWQAGLTIAIAAISRSSSQAQRHIA